MSFITQLLSDLRVRLAGLFRRDALNSRLDEEIRFHIELREQRLQEQGMSPEEARSRARLEFGNRVVIAENTRENWRYGGMERLLKDIRYALRTLLRTPGFTAVAVLSLALGIGANSTIFTVIDHVMLRMLPVEDPNGIVVWAGTFSHPRYVDVLGRTESVFSGLMAFSSLSRVSIDGSDSNFGEGRLVSGNYFEVLGVKPLLGRLITSHDDRVPGAHPVIVISHAFWQRYFRGDPSIVGRSIRLSPGTLTGAWGTGGFEQTNDPSRSSFSGGFTIVGVTQPGFFGETVGQHPDFWAPLMMQEHFMPGRPWLQRTTARWLSVIGRLKAGVSREQAQAAGTIALQESLRSDPTANQSNIAQTRAELREGDKGLSPLRGNFSQPLLILMFMVGVVLLIACANLANLLLARATARRREIAIRLAIGAGKRRVFRQLLTESIILAMLGGTVALAVAYWGSRTMFNMVAEGDSAARLNLAPDLRTLAFTGAVALLTALLFGLTPALRAVRTDLNSVLKDGGPAVSVRFGMARVLVALQVALSVILLIGTGLFTRTLYNLKAQDLGYSPERLIIMKVDPISAGLQGAQIGRVGKDLLDKIRAIPGVRSATFSENGLFSGTESGAPVRIEGYPPASEADRRVRYDQVGPGYFTNVGIPILAGRDFADTDNAANERVAVINQNMAQFYFADSNPIGRQIFYEGTARATVTVVGVAGNARDHSLRDQVYRRMYVSFMQPIDGLTGANYEVRTAINAAEMAKQLRAAVAEVAPEMPVIRIEPLTTLMDQTMLRERTIARLSVLFGVLAVVLASVGLYGVLTYSVSRRTNEIGLRIAIGAEPRRIVWTVLRETFAPVAGGILIGVPIAAALSRYVETLLFNLKRNDALTISAAIVLIILIAAVAGLVPARRAAKIDPLRALRHE